MDAWPPSIAEAPDGSAWVTTVCGSGDNELLGWNGANWAVVPHPQDVRVLAEDRPYPLPSCG
jgi:hypothetical protein